MPDIQLPADMGAWMREVEQRLRMVETRPSNPVRASWGPTQNRSNTSWAVLPNGPSVTVNIGPSQSAYVTVVSDVGLNVVNQTGVLGVYVGGAYYANGWLSVSSSNSDTTIASRLGSTIVVTGLAVGSMTFTAAVYVTTGNVNYSNTDIIVQPI